MPLLIQDAHGNPHELEGTAVGITIKSWWPSAAGDLAARGYPGAFLVDYTPPPPDPQPSPVPLTVTPRQARLALLAAGHLDAVNTAVAAAGAQAQIDWDYALEIRRDNALIASLAAGIGLTEQDIDDLFISAAGF